MAVDVPNSPANGDTMIVGSRTWRYNSATTTWEPYPDATPDYSTIFLMTGA